MVHPAYNNRNLNSDVAVLELNAPILTITPAVVVGANDTSLEWAGTGLTVVGWGNTEPATLHRQKVHYPERLKEKTTDRCLAERCPMPGNRRPSCPNR